MISAMSNFDSEKERRRLVEYYAGLLDGELEKIAEDSGSLTDLARETLDAELSRRNLTKRESVSPPPDAAAATEEVEFQKLVAIRTFGDFPNALLAKGILESASIYCDLADINMVRIAWFVPGLGTGIKLMVMPEDAEVASQLLDAPHVELSPE